MVNPNKPTHIIVHCSSSVGGNAALIDEDHRKSRGFRAIGYHYVILNGRTTWAGRTYAAELDGAVEAGRAPTDEGAHCPGFNARSLGVCLIGKRGTFTAQQMASARRLVRQLMVQYGISAECVLGHSETPSGHASGKTCPDLDMNDFRAQLQ
jgi:N-acetyl-anhydromuramyl-L-alanine amidase AmpD